MKQVRNILFIGITILVTAIAFFAGGLLVGGYGGYRVTTATVEAPQMENPEAEYYRGIYDICIQQTHKVDFCLAAVRKVTGAKWYEKPSKGWAWPLSANDTVAQSE